MQSYPKSEVLARWLSSVKLVQHSSVTHVTLYSVATRVAMTIKCNIKRFISESLQLTSHSQIPLSHLISYIHPTKTQFEASVEYKPIENIVGIEIFVPTPFSKSFKTSVFLALKVLLFIYLFRCEWVLHNKYGASLIYYVGKPNI